jgi:hypothetical protein
MHRKVHTPFFFLLVIYELEPENQAVRFLELCDDAAGCFVCPLWLFVYRYVMSASDERLNSVLEIKNMAQLWAAVYLISKQTNAHT